jgi:murein DD-endopeptidase MepM/ murein hydrolase activator NlpD
MTDYRAPIRALRNKVRAFGARLSARIPDWKGKTRKFTRPVGSAFSRVGARRLLLAGGAAVVLAGGAGYGHHYVKANTVSYYELYRDGALIGTVESKEAVESFLSAKRAELAAANPGITMELETGELTYVERSEYKAQPDTEAALAALEGMLDSHAVGVEVRVNGKLIAVVPDEAAAKQALERVKSEFGGAEGEDAAVKPPEVTALAYGGNAASAEEPKIEVESVRIVEQVDTGRVEIDPARISDAETLYERLVEGTTKRTTYIVQPGDCIVCIAKKFDISPEIIYKNNPWIEDDLIRVGDELDLTVLQPFVTVETVERVSEIEEIAPEVIIRKNDEMRAGQQKTIQAGVPGTKRVTYRLVKQNGWLMSEEIVDEQVIEPAVPEIIMKGTKIIRGVGTGKFSWPVSGAKITSKFGKRWGRQHKGIDLIGNRSILASDNGVVTYAGRKNGLGNAVIIDHQNGYKTVYGHLSKINVKKGQTVAKGDKIGVMGSTGNSTGVHLHFEIHKNGTPQNPLNYL